MSRKFSSVLSVLLAGTLVLAACGSDSAEPPENSASPEPSASVAPSSEPSAAPTPEQTNASDGFIPASDKSKSPAAATNRTDTLIIGMEDFKGLFNGIYGETVYDNYVNNTLFDKLVNVQKDGTYEPSVAEKWEVSDDKLVYTFYLRDDVKFTDGTPLTAEDVAFTLTVKHDKSYDGPSDIMKAKIKGGKEYKDGTASEIEGIKIINEHTIEITTTEVSASTLPNVGDFIIPKHYYGADYKQGSLDYMKNLHQKPLGSGPYIMETYIPGQEVRFVANENYFKGKPKIPKLIFKVTTTDTNIQSLQAGETDAEAQVSVSTDNLELLKSLGFLDIYLFPTNGYGYIGFNHKDEKFKDKRVRQALTYGLNREEIVQAVYQGNAKVINIPQSNVSWAYTDDIKNYEFNLEKAAQLLDEAGWKVGADGIREKDGVKFKIHFLATTPNPVNEAIIPVAQENYGDLGILFEPDMLDFNAVKEKQKKGEFDMFFLAWQLTEDPDSTNVFGTNGSQNEIGYSNPKVDELLLKGIQELDIEKRKPIYHELYKELNEDPPYIFMYQRTDILPVNARVQGWDLSSFKRFPFSLYQVSIN
ncbi:ABC transporter substrate-binding protein [Paenibacillus sp. J2TS4]|uniref:ABC transporter substrate-binding protein n=1 Tax=Paenibacillus sp. J2TS4 TaxID=2807194 RepID=UPI001AFEB2D2|nr:ABC transporter substrate-binding protein [Paenibacillus sp. J2TS4]GIP32720.1 ABC transporter substrate-binding protein [Paenibacillus sp. J2TS4]